MSIWEGGIHSVMVTDVRNGHSDTSSNFGWDCLYFM